MKFPPIKNTLPKLSLSSALCTLLLATLTAFLVPGLRSQDESEALFTRALQDYTQNRFTDAQSEFEKVQGAHAQEAKQYVARIKAYKEDMEVADSFMRRMPDEIDASSVEYAIQKYEDALQIKPDGPGNPKQALEKAKALHAQLVQKGSKNVEARDRDFCAKALVAVQEHHYKEAELFSCPLANDNPSYPCGEDEAVHMCQQMRELAKLGGSSGANFAPPRSEGNANNSASTGTEPTDRAKAAFDNNDFGRARTLFTRLSPELKPAADEYLDKISHYQEFMAQAEKLSQSGAYDEARVAFINAANIKADGPGNPRAQALLMELEEGIDQFYSGDYVSAARNLEGYARDSTEREPLAHFYLGASKLARFFITGNEDASLQQDALNDLKIAKQAGFKAGQDVSPKILKAYNELAF